MVPRNRMHLHLNVNRPRIFKHQTGGRKMINKEPNSAGDDPAIIYQNIFNCWKAGKKMKEISEQSGLSLKTVMRILKKKQKSIIERKG